MGMVDVNWEMVIGKRGLGNVKIHKCTITFGIHGFGDMLWRNYNRGIGDCFNIFWYSF